jgi:hypothetical protein
MNKNIIIILVLVSILTYLCFSDKIENFAQNMRLSNIYGASSSRTKQDDLYHIGVDDDNEEVYQFKNNTFKLGNNDIFQPYEPKKVKYLPVAVKIPSVVTTKSIKSKVPMKMEGYKFRGLIANVYYKQFYVMYEKEYDNYQREDKLYEYLLVKKIEDKFKVVYNVPPRSRVESGDTIYFSYGNFQLGPLKFV